MPPHHPVAKILSYDIDMGIVTTKPKPDGLSSVEVFNDEICAVLHKEHPLHAKDYLEAEDFSSVHLIIHSYPLETVSVFQHYLKPNNIQPARISAIPFTELSFEMVSSNMGIMCVPKWSLDSFKIPDYIVFKKISKTGLKRTHSLVFRTEDRTKKYLNAFIQSFKEDFSQKASWEATRDPK